MIKIIKEFLRVLLPILIPQYQFDQHASLLFYIIPIMSTNQVSINRQQLIEEGQKQDDQPVFFSLVERVGSFGKYQKISIIFWCALIFLCGEILFGTPFLFYQDDYDCQGLDPSINCKDYVCGLQDESMRKAYIPTPSINSLANAMGDYRCPSKRVILDNIIAVMFFGIALGYLLLTLFGQLVGKKLLMLINLACYIAGIGCVILFYQNEILVAGALMAAVLGISNCFIICFMFLIETVQTKAREKFTVIIQAFYGVGAVFNILLYWLVNDWKVIFQICYLIPSIVLFVCMFLFLVDTPMSLIIRNPTQYALSKLKYMGKLNGSKAQLTVKDIQSVKDKYNKKQEKQVTIRKITIIEIFKFKSTRFLAILLILLQCSISFSFYAPSLMLSSFKFNIYINGLAVSVSQIAANFSAWIIVGRFRRKIISYCNFGSMFACSIILVFIWDQNSDKSNSTTMAQQIIVLLLIFLFQFFITQQYAIFYVFENELFPTQARMTAVSMVSLMGGLSSTATSKIVGFCLRENFPVMVIFSALTILCMIIIANLPQTFQKTPKEMIQQLTQEQKIKVNKKNELLQSQTY